ncbi:MAG: dihydroxy-acid dehydratase [Lacunisphaera sp.]
MASARPDGSPIALGYHTGHWEVGLLMEEAAKEFTAARAIPFAGYVSDPCDGRTNGTNGMLDSLPYRNDAAIVLRRLIRSLPTRRGVPRDRHLRQGPARDAHGARRLPDLATILVPGGVTLLAEEAEDTGKVQTLATRFARDEISLEHAAEMGCKACGSPGGGPCQFMGTAATSQVVPRRSACRCRTRRSRLPVRKSGATSPVARPALCSHSTPRAPRRATFSRTIRSTMPSSATPRSAVRPISCCTCPRSRTPPGCVVRPSTIGCASTGRCRASSIRCPTARNTTPPCRSISRAACPRRCCICATSVC